MNAMWKLQDAKSRFSELVDAALVNGPQYVTRRGTEAVVVLAVKDYRAMAANKPDFNDFLLACPGLDEGLDVARQADYPRDIAL